MRQHDSKRRNASPLSTVRAWRYGALIAGDDAMPLHRTCTDPIYREVRGAESTVLQRLRVWRDDPELDYAPGHGWIGDIEPQPPKTDTAYIKVRCRKCQACLDFRRRQWTAKAIAEVRMSRRTWFVTLTFAPPARFVMKARAESRVRTRRCEAFEMLTPDERFKAIAAEASREVTLWLKRVRKNSGVPLRYMLVSEAHKDGFPHFHLLIHEADNGSVSKRDIQTSWRVGFSHAKLLDTADAKAIGYTCKYLNKSASTRVRASQHYGQLRGAGVHVVEEKIRTILDAASNRTVKNASLLPKEKAERGEVK